MKDLKAILVQAKHIPEISSLTTTEEFRNSIITLTTDINNTSDYISNRKKRVNFSTINSNLENIATTISDFETQLKRQ